MSNLEKIVKEIEAELDRAVVKFPTWPTRALDAMAVVAEESGELTKATLECTYEHPKSSQSDVRKEAVQTAAMAIRFLLSMDEYDFRPAPQHDQKII